MISNINNSNTISIHFLTVIKKGLESHGVETYQLLKKANNVAAGVNNQLVRVKQQDIDTILMKQSEF